MRVLLADVPAREWGYDASYPNMGILYLISYLRSRRPTNQVTVAYLDARKTLAQHVEAVREYSPDLYALSISSLAVSRLPGILEAVKAVAPRAEVVCGGTGATADPGSVLLGAPVDACVVGEGEETFSEVVAATAESHGSVRTGLIPGTAVRRDGSTELAPDRELIGDLDTIPFPAWDLIDFSVYPGMHLKRASPETNVLVSRGCPYNCCFCSNPVWKHRRPWLRSRSPANVAEEVELLYNRGVREIYLASDEMNFDERYALSLCEELARLGHRDLYFQCNMRAHPLSDELAQALRGMNCWLVHLGVESANDRVLRGIGKHVTVAQIEAACERLARNGVRVYAFMMLYQAWEEDGLLQCETTDEVANSLRFTRRMFRHGLIHYMSWQVCTPLPGSRLYAIAQRHGLMRDDPRAGYEHRLGMTVPGVTDTDVRRMLRKGILLKDWYMLRSGQISFRHLGRAWENLRSAVGL
ncbi:MAG: radical SAM protein [Armatimonadota bacterium]